MRSLQPEHNRLPVTCLVLLDDSYGALLGVAAAARGRSNQFAQVGRSLPRVSREAINLLFHLPRLMLQACACWIVRCATRDVSVGRFVTMASRGALASRLELTVRHRTGPVTRLTAHVHRSLVGSGSLASRSSREPLFHAPKSRYCCFLLVFSIERPWR